MPRNWKFCGAIANCHPRFQFEGTAPDDISNYTNRAPFPTLHLLREASIERAVAAFPEARRFTSAILRHSKRWGMRGGKPCGANREQLVKVQAWLSDSAGLYEIIKSGLGQLQTIRIRATTV
jgi:hypothetical protein